MTPSLCTLSLRYPSFVFNSNHRKHCQGGNFEDFIAAQRSATLKQYFPQKDLLHYFAQLAEVIKFLHQKGYVHATGGLSMESIFSEGYMFTDVLLDIGQSANIGTHDKEEDKLKHLLPPESHENPKNTEKGDIYSLGVIFFQMATLLVSI